MKREPYGLVLSMESHTPVCEPEKMSDEQMETNQREGDEIFEQVAVAMDVMDRMEEVIDIAKTGKDNGGLSAAAAKALNVAVENFLGDVGIQTQGLIPSERAFAMAPEEATDIAISGLTVAAESISDALKNAWNVIAEKTNVALYKTLKTVDSTHAEIQRVRKLVDASEMEKVEAFQSPDIAKALAINGRVPDDIPKSLMIFQKLQSSYVDYLEQTRGQLKRLSKSVSIVRKTGNIEAFDFHFPSLQGGKKVSKDEVTSLINAANADDEVPIEFWKTETAPGQIYIGAIFPKEDNIYNIDDLVQKYKNHSGINVVKGDQTIKDANFSTLSKRQALELLNKCEELLKFMKTEYLPKFTAVSHIKLNNEFSFHLYYSGIGYTFLNGIVDAYSNILWRASDISNAALNSISAVIDLVKKSID